MDNRRDFFTLMGAAIAAGGAGVASAKVPDAVRVPSEAQTLDHDFGKQQIYYVGATDQLENFEGGSLRLDSGREPHPPHRHPEEEILLVTEGRCEISIDGEISTAGPGAMMFCAAERLHGIRNIGSEPVLFYYFKWKKKG